VQNRLPISLCAMVKNEEHNIRDLLESVVHYVSEIVIVDTGSTDRTVEIAKEYTDRVYNVGFTNFGDIRTLLVHLSNQPWVLMLDGDERLEPGAEKILEQLVVIPPATSDNGELDDEGNVVTDAYLLPRKRWADSWMQKQVDMESYPDWQMRFFRNHTKRRKIVFLRKLHELPTGAVKAVELPNGPVINHFQGVGKSIERQIERARQYTKLYEEDVADGVEYSNPPLIPMDTVDGLKEDR
jgi:glycosyltransferase involved in cell wall biosynthesis